MCKCEYRFFGRDEYKNMFYCVKCLRVVMISHYGEVRDIHKSPFKKKEAIKE